MKLSGHGPVDLIVNGRRKIEKLFGLLVILSLLCVPLVGINYDLTAYLPSYASTSQAIKIMEHDFTYPGVARVMLKDVTLYEAKAYKDRIAKVKGVDTVLWCDTKENIFGSSQFIDYQDITDYYKDNTACMDIIFLQKDSSTQTHTAVREIKSIVGSQGVIGGSAVSDTMLGPTLNAQISVAMVIAVLCIYLILTLTTTSWFEPILFLMVMGVAIIINNGTNIFLGKISFLTNSVSSILQLAVSIDYSIFLLHGFTREKAQGIPPEQAMANALRSNAILPCGMATFFGFIALTMMQFSIGRDMGIVLAKGIIVSLLTVMMLMPALILRFEDKITKYQHRPFLPGFRKVGEAIYKIRIPMVIIVALLIVPCRVGQEMCNFSYGNEGVSNSPGTEVYRSDQQMDAKFGKSNVMLAMVPVGNNIKEKALVDKLKDLSYVKDTVSLASVLPAGIPEDFLPRSLTSELHSAHWARIIISVNSAGESTAAFRYTDAIRKTIQNAYAGQQIYLIGTTPSTEDIKNIIIDDYARVDMVSLISVAVVVAIAFRSLVLPVVVLIPIEAAVFINMVIPYITNQRVMFLGYIIVSCIQLGATVDYSILLTSNYLDARAQGDRKEAAIRSVADSAQSILTSGTILTLAGYGVYAFTTVQAISTLGEMIGRGALLSTILVLTLLPACLMMFDRWFVKKDYAEKKHAKLNRIRAHRLILPRVSALQAQAAELHHQMKANRRARRRAFWNSLRGRSIGGEPPEPPAAPKKHPHHTSPSENGAEQEEHSDETK